MRTHSSPSFLERAIVDFLRVLTNKGLTEGSHIHEQRFDFRDREAMKSVKMHIFKYVQKRANAEEYLEMDACLTSLDSSNLETLLSFKATSRCFDSNISLLFRKTTKECCFMKKFQY